MHQEYAKQKGCLKKGAGYLREKFLATSSAHHSHNSSMISDNVQLIDEIVNLREVHKQLLPYRKKAELLKLGSTPSSLHSSPLRYSLSPDNNKLREIAQQREEIKALRLKIKELELQPIKPTKLEPIDKDLAS